MKIFDLGANHGEDTARYLQMGAEVVAVEANPILAGELRTTFAEALSEGRLTIENVGVWHERGKLPFYVNSGNDHHSSLIIEHGSHGGQYTTLEVDTVLLDDLIEKHGMPHYLKIDIEGADRYIVRQLQRGGPRPKWISLEEYGCDAIEDLAMAGYVRFQFVPQGRKSSWTPPEGQPRYTWQDTGPPPWELPGSWLAADQALDIMDRLLRARDGTFVGNPNEWFDIHACALA